MNQNWKGSKPQKSLPAQYPLFRGIQLNQFYFYAYKSMFIYSFPS